MLFTIPHLQLAAVFCSLALATASIDCLSELTHNEFAEFNGAPVTFKLGLLNATACGQYCERVKECQAWSYVEGGGECDLYSTSALSTTEIHQFVHGRCSGRTVEQN
ncbi:hypothetical protein BDV29DRAFT_162992 [Aspergillus leporis]|jgi:hypothetical protein|uniref:Apple domain-containing protein n=1 Tax=Aspergillus leporis TaxID=41062 RepID=A0A5N5WH83_9EURO|nr:hypothetical protein BDV29DRAFT_162992 [Aspergillus leporis]